MNVYHLNTRAESSVILNANFDINRYLNFIWNSIEFLNSETLSMKVSKKVVEVEVEIDGEKRKRQELRYFPESPNSKKVEKAIEVLFNENTKVVYDQNKDFRPHLSIEVIDKNEEDNYIILPNDIDEDRIYLRPDTYQLVQQRKALKTLRDQPLSEHLPLLNLFGYPNSQVWEQSFYEEDYDWKILDDESKSGVYEQREFVAKAMKTKDFALLEGPPGSGKTTTIIELIMQYAAEGKRVLLCSATHAAIDNVIERIKGRYKDVCDEEIVPVRISSFDKPVKESVRPYLLKNLISTYKSGIEKHLKNNQALGSQQFLSKNLYRNSKHKVDPIEQVILDSANLVGGTMIGILQHPDIKANRQGASFDVLIVDEASKVTFSEFIVPALHAKKWILVGDVKQLSPYVEDDYVSENIATMVDADMQNAIVNQFELKTKLDDKRFDDCLKVFFTHQNLKSERCLIEDREVVIEAVDENWKPTEENVTRINAADVVLAKNDSRVKQLLSTHLLVKSIFINEETSDVNQRYRQDYDRRTFRRPLPYLFDSRQEKWSEMVSSRLSQSFGFRNAGPEFENIDRELEYLIPQESKDEINQIKQLVFPSILELLQNGIGKGQGQRSDRVLSDGFHSTFKTSRFVSLSFQHRMHPDIAKTSKEKFYQANLESANTVLEDRGWKYALNEPAVKWIHNTDKTGNERGGKIWNPTECRDMKRELKKFLNWAKDNPRANGEKYELAVLTFYLNQVAELRRMIREVTGQDCFSRFYKSNTNIYLYTVDKFQGQEADMVLLGFTKNTRNAHFNSPNRLNVALTRARHKLVLFGNQKWFEERAKLDALRYLATEFKSTIRYEK